MTPRFSKIKVCKRDFQGLSCQIEYLSKTKSWTHFASLQELHQIPTSYFRGSYHLLVNFTCTIIYAEAITQSAARNNPPTTKLDSCEKIWWFWEKFAGDSIFRSVGPLYKVATNAPAIDTKVPTNLAKLLELLQSNLSILKPTSLNQCELLIWNAYLVI